MRQRVLEVLGVFWPLVLVLAVQLVGAAAVFVVPDEHLSPYAAVGLRVGAVACLLLGLAVQVWVARRRDRHEPR